jgi:hypothetical protein
MVDLKVFERSAPLATISVALKHPLHQPLIQALPQFDSLYLLQHRLAFPGLLSFSQLMQDRFNLPFECRKLSGGHIPNKPQVHTEILMYHLVLHARDALPGYLGVSHF